MADTNTATITLGDPKASHLGSRDARIDHQPVGMDFHERRWPMDQLGHVRYLQGPHSFDIPRVSGIMGSSYPDDPQRGIFAWHVRAFPMANERIPHRLARDRLFELFAVLRRAGWRRYSDLGEPRLAGEQALRYALTQHDSCAQDPSYIPSMAEWMQISRTLPYWQLWADGSYMTLRVIDEPALRNPDQPGVYMFSIDIESESANYQHYFEDPDDMHRWKQLIPAEIRRLAALRDRAEDKLRREGFTIDTSYQDPPILALSQGA